LTEPAPRNGTFWPLLGIVMVAVTLGTGHVIARWAYANGVNVLTAAALRPFVTALLLLVLLIARRERPFPPTRAAKWTILLGLCIAVQSVSIQTAVSLMPVGIAILTMYLFPFLTGLASAWFGDVRFTARLGAALGAALVGLAMVVGVGTATPSPLGVALAFIAALAFTTALVLTPRLAPTLGAPLRTFYTMLIAGTVLMTTALATGSFEIPASTEGRIGLALLSLFYAIGISTLFLLLPRLGAVQIAVVLNLEPVLVALIAAFALGEALTFAQWLGTAIVVGAVILYQISEHARARR
jgi:drug/metabolite transporter (DMT)-like permease